MPTTTALRRLAVSAAAGAAAVSLISAPAHANDHTWVLQQGGVKYATATWTDRTDTLCITVHAGRAKAYGRVGIWRIDGVREPDRAIREASTTKGMGRYCTGNLSIPEDIKYGMQVQWFGPGAPPTDAHTSKTSTFFS